MKAKIFGRLESMKKKFKLPFPIEWIGIIWLVGLTISIIISAPSWLTFFLLGLVIGDKIFSMIVFYHTLFEAHAANTYINDLIARDTLIHQTQRMQQSSSKMTPNEE